MFQETQFVTNQQTYKLLIHLIQINSFVVHNLDKHHRECNNQVFGQEPKPWFIYLFLFIIDTKGDRVSTNKLFAPTHSAQNKHSDLSIDRLVSIGAGLMNCLLSDGSEYAHWVKN